MRTRVVVDSVDFPFGTLAIKNEPEGQAKNEAITSGHVANTLADLGMPYTYRSQTVLKTRQQSHAHHYRTRLCSLVEFYTENAIGEYVSRKLRACTAYVRDRKGFRDDEILI